MSTDERQVSATKLKSGYALLGSLNEVKTENEQSEFGGVS